MIRVLSKGIVSNNPGIISAVKLSILVAITVLVFGSCGGGNVKFENAA